jgi:hypothetical protein
MNAMTSGMKASDEVSGIVELRRRSRAGIIAVLYRGRQSRQVIRLKDGTIAEVPTPDQRCEAPGRLDECIGIASGGVPATVHHFNLGLVVDYVTLEGVYVLPSGEVAAIYGAEAIPLG